ncbi:MULTISPECIES: hypothetical protein [Methylomonas]|uniref:Uncharacterized protein n=1 Tax=Methylomonas denitrificans TaxID=1538553 RepID=A0A140E6T9_9GAMM|nr:MULTISPECIES: hypothetical protein [Methylomonas]AMK79113.1 hypothetical protein JT25_021955 [Methylomonas denitrificans]OAH99618.1 hypothetical protein A1342_07790 [Methylomonas methanica]
MELFSTYPAAYLMTVVLPLVTGIVVAIGGYETLKARSESDAQLNRIEQNTENALKQLPDVTATLATLRRYEQSLAASGARDEVLSAVLAQYQGMKHASEAWERFRSSKDNEEKYQLASEVLEILSTNLMPVSTPTNLPSNPLILGLGANTFRVLFSVPMRITPHLEFQVLPAGANAHVIEKSKFGFTVVFEPISVLVTQFGFTASAEL